MWWKIIDKDNFLCRHKTSFEISLNNNTKEIYLEVYSDISPNFKTRTAVYFKEMKIC